MVSDEVWTDEGFQTPESRLIEGLHHDRPMRSLDKFGLGGFLRKRFESLPFAASLFHHPGKDASLWKKKAREFFRSEMLIPGALGSPVDAVVLGRSQHRGYTVEEVEFTVTPPLRTSATVVIPENGRARHPAIVALHSFGGVRLFGREKLLEFSGEPEALTKYRKTYYSGRSLQIELAKAGFLSIAIDAFNFGERTAAAISDPEGFRQWRMSCSVTDEIDFSMKASATQEPEAVRTLECLGVSLASLIATDDVRTVDYLLTRPDVDPGGIGCTGLSFGSFRTNYLAALDDRVRAAASVCWISTMKGILDYNILGAMGFFALPPGLYGQLDMSDIVALACPKAFLAISGWQDRLMQPSGVAEAHLFFRRVWAESGCADTLGSLIYDAPHCFNSTMQDATMAFFQRHLTRDLALEERERLGELLPSGEIE